MPALGYNEHRAHAGRQVPAGAELGCGRCSGDFLSVSVAVALSSAVSRAEGRVTPSIRNAFTPANYDFATHRRDRDVFRGSRFGLNVRTARGQASA
jgi:hypothetical protein